ncbi:hypothetical protein NB693_21480 [Pantoea ananatis]|uniref:hypothetical protein n=1 Tax=Pantoea ananas TaxID=553 RepID=UPI0022200CE3|nr:hypothetical protein [Pantoea ananatis]
MKLVKHLANLGYGSRKQVALMFREGRITDAEGGGRLGRPAARAGIRESGLGIGNRGVAQQRSSDSTPASAAGGSGASAASARRSSRSMLVAAAHAAEAQVDAAFLAGPGPVAPGAGAAPPWADRG